VDVTGGILEQESQTLLQNFFRAKRDAGQNKNEGPL